MSRNCCVPECQNSGTEHPFPEDPELRQKWILAIRRPDSSNEQSWQPLNQSIICEKHFTDEDYTTEPLGEQKRLRADALPKLHIDDLTVSEEAIQPKKRRHTSDMEQMNEHQFEEILCDVDEAPEVIVESLDTVLPTFADKATSTPHTPADCNLTCSSSQTDISSRTFSIHNFTTEPAIIKYYTSFENYDHFMLLFNLLGPAVSHLIGLENIDIPPEDQLFITLMKLCQAKDDFELSIFFNLSPHQVAVVFNTWINFIFLQFGELDINAREIMERLQPRAVINGRNASSNRNHEDSVKRLADTYTILKRNFNSNLTAFDKRIIDVCFYLCLIRPYSANR